MGLLTQSLPVGSADPVAAAPAPGAHVHGTVV